MKRTLVAIVGVALLLSASAGVNADATAWFALATGNPDGTVVTQGAGQNLVIDNANLATTTYNVEFWVRNDGPNAMIGYALNLSTADATTALSNNIAVPIPGAFNIANGTAGAGPGLLLDDLAQSAFSGFIASGTTVLGATFTLTVTGPALGNIDIIAGSGTSQTWNDTTFGNINVAFGANPPILGTPGAVSAGPSIIIQNIPEPGTLALLGVGLVGLIRRRR